MHTMHTTYQRPRKAKVRARLPVERPFAFYLRRPLLGMSGGCICIPWPKPRAYRTLHQRTAPRRRTNNANARTHA